MTKVDTAYKQVDYLKLSKLLIKKKISMRTIVKCSDVQVFLGKSKETCYKNLREIRKSLGKKSRYPITIKEFDAYYKLVGCGIGPTIQEIDALKQCKITVREIMPLEIPKPTCEKPYAFSRNNNC